MVGGHILRQNRPGRRQQLDRLWCDATGVELFDPKNLAAVDLETDRRQRVATLNLEARLQGHFAGHRIGHIDLEARGLLVFERHRTPSPTVIWSGVLSHRSVQCQCRDRLAGSRLKIASI